MRMIIAAVGALALSGTLPAYQYEISGYPPPPSSVTAAANQAVETGRGSLPFAMQSLEARYRTFLATEAGGLVTTPFVGFHLIVR